MKNEDSDETVQMHKLIFIFTTRGPPKISFLMKCLWYEIKMLICRKTFKPSANNQDNYNGDFALITCRKIVHVALEVLEQNHLNGDIPNTQIVLKQFLENGR